MSALPTSVITNAIISTATVVLLKQSRDILAKGYYSTKNIDLAPIVCRFRKFVKYYMEKLFSEVKNVTE